MKKALITGITGQDGSYLAELLLDYVRRASLGMDLPIFFGTFGAMFVKRTGM